MATESQGFAEATKSLARQHIEAMRRQLEPLSSSPRPPDLAESSGDIEPDDSARMLYEMELAAHRDTTRQLLAAKDQVIASLQAQIAQLQQERHR